MASRMRTSFTQSTMHLHMRTLARTLTGGCSSAPDTAGNLLEVVVMTTAQAGPLVIHAMPMREEYRRLLER
jgi:hypothetical protein